MWRFRKNQKGFTLVELLVVIVIIAILAAIAIPSYMGYLDKMKEQVCVYNRTELKRYCLMHTMISSNNNIIDLNLVFHSDEIQSQISENSCPNKGLFYVKNDEILCSFHDGGPGDNGDGPEDDKDDFLDPEWNQNYGYHSVSYKSNKTYAYGDIVELNGVLYQCINSAKSSGFDPGQYQVDSQSTWRVIGTKDQSPVPYNIGHSYAVGTIVTLNGTTYMFTPPYNDSSYSNHNPQSSKDIWTEITAEKPAKKPPVVSVPASGAMEITASTAYKKGEYYYDVGGVLYQYHGVDGGQTAPDYYSITNGTWKQESNIYLYKNAKYSQGDKVWYNGKYYIAQKDFTTYENDGTLPTQANSVHWKSAD